MLATIRNWIPWKLALLAVLGILTSCATKKTAFINDPNDKKETAIPWNEQTKWEREGEGAGLNQQRR